MLINVTNTQDGKPDVLDYLDKQNFARVLDIGGVMNPWAGDYITYYIDLLNIKKYLINYPHLLTEKVANAKMFIGDINDNFGWDEVFVYVQQNGKFDFVICTQTLEDIRNPSYVLRILPRIAKEGFISVPCKHAELCREIECGTDQEQEQWGLQGKFRGFFHHRWIGTVRDSKFVLYPKLNFIEYLTCLDWATKENKDRYYHELSFWWIEKLPFEIVNKDFMGPNGPTFLKWYEGIWEGL